MDLNRGKKRILISDCDTDVLIALEHALEDDGFDTTTASTTAETLGLLRTREFDLVLAADHPPEVDCERVIQEARIRTVPLIATQNVPRHPFAAPYLIYLGAKKVVQKREHQEVHDAVNEVLFGRSGGKAKSVVAASGQLGVS